MFSVLNVPLIIWHIAMFHHYLTNWIAYVNVFAHYEKQLMS